VSSEKVDPEPDAMAALEELLGYQFEDRTLLETALQHASYAHENADRESNERLEFLGDAVLGLVVGHLLFEAHPDWREGDLTRGLHQLVDKRGLALLGRKLNLGPHLRLGRTELQSDGQAKDSILADTTEAVVAAMYLDGGLEAVADFARRVFADAVAPGAPRAARDPKTRFQEWAMAKYGVFPSYEAIHDSDVEGDEHRFTMRLSVTDEEWAWGSGRSKRAAERAAAAKALVRRDELRSNHGRESGDLDQEIEAPGGESD
jgi:ribonuclease III